MSRARIFAVLVLYKRSLEESETFSTLRSLLQKRTDLAGAMSLLLYDNSPVAQEVPALPIPTQYISDPSNPGLAAAYSAGLQLAGEEAADWLLLLDQDTLLTETYLTEVVSSTQLAGDDQFDAIVPKLVEDGTVLSPHLTITLRHPKPVDITTHGISTELLHPYNSGAVLRVKAVQEMKGFPEGFSLDYLDHATFRRLQSRGGKIFVMQAILQHKLSTNRADVPDDPVLLARQKSVLQAEQAFYRDFGAPRERFYYHVRLVWRAWKAMRAGRFRTSMMFLKTSVIP
jgi:GT2 family glycosyltransferase